MSTLLDRIALSSQLFRMTLLILFHRIDGGVERVEEVGDLFGLYRPVLHAVHGGVDDIGVVEISVFEIGVEWFGDVVVLVHVFLSRAAVSKDPLVHTLRRMADCESDSLHVLAADWLEIVLVKTTYLNAKRSVGGPSPALQK